MVPCPPRRRPTAPDGPPARLARLPRVSPFAVIVAALAAGAAPTPAAAWSEAGHRIVGAIADARMGPAARRLVREIVGTLPLSDHSIALWADDVRDDRTGPWHYVNVPRDAGGYVAARDCTSRGCVVSAIDDAAAVLRDADDPHRLADALRFLVHFAGDVHNPMHVGEVRDRGGNNTLVRLGPRREQPISVHRLWDYHVLRPILRGHDPIRAARALSATISPAAAAAWVEPLDPAAWASESHRSAREIVQEIERMPAERGVPRLPRGYVDAHRERTAVALQKAGVRLAALLDRIAEARERRAVRR